MKDQYRSLQQKASLSDHSLTTEEWRRQKPELLQGPSVMCIVAT
jgi:hypothetical protein